jgi:hypothetical protein
MQTYTWTLFQNFHPNFARAYAPDGGANTATSVNRPIFLTVRKWCLWVSVPFHNIVSISFVTISPVELVTWCFEFIIVLRQENCSWIVAKRFICQSKYTHHNLWDLFVTSTILSFFQMLHCAWVVHLSKYTDFIDTVNFYPEFHFININYWHRFLKSESSTFYVFITGMLFPNHWKSDCLYWNCRLENW